MRSFRETSAKIEAISRLTTAGAVCFLAVDGTFGLMLDTWLEGVETFNSFKAVSPWSSLNEVSICTETAGKQDNRLSGDQNLNMVPSVTRRIQLILLE